jgi:hypothetical protein
MWPLPTMGTIIGHLWTASWYGVEDRVKGDWPHWKLYLPQSSSTCALMKELRKMNNILRTKM